MSLKRRVESLEAKTKPSLASEQAIPISCRVHLKAVERWHAKAEGREPPAYTQEEIEEMREDGLENVAGRGVVVELRETPGWQSAEAQQLLDSWEEDARWRLEQGEDLPPERWWCVWGVDDEEDVEGS